MRQLSVSKIDWVLAAIRLASLTLCSLLYYFKTEIDTIIAIDLSPISVTSFTLFYCVLFSAFSHKKNCVDTIKTRLAPTISRKKDYFNSLLLGVRCQITHHQKTSIYFLVGIILLAVIAWMLPIGQSKSITLIFSTLLLFDLFHHVRVYFQLDNFIAETQTKIDDLITENNKNKYILKNLEEQSKTNPIENTEHLKGYLSPHH